MSREILGKLKDYSILTLIYLLYICIQYLLLKRSVL